eukprot:6221507-Pyramimonas_sp.AAC.1
MFNHPVQRLVAPYGAPSGTARMRPIHPFKELPPTQYSASWPHGELHRRPQCYRPLAFPPPPSAALRGPTSSFTENDIHTCGAHNCIWWGPSPGKC